MHTADATGAFIADGICIGKQRYTLFIYGKRRGTKKRLNRQCRGHETGNAKK